MPNLSGPNPLSLGEYQAYAGQSGYPAAVSGLGNLLGGVIGDPSRIAQATYLGAQTGHARAETEKINKTLQDKSEVASLLSNPAKFQNPQVIQRVGALLAGNEELAKSVPTAISMLTQIAAQRGADASAQAMADRLASGLGVASYGSTATGLGQTIAGQQAVANTQAQAQRDVENLREAGLDRRTIGTVNSPNGPVMMTNVEAGQTHAPGYDSAMVTHRATIEAGLLAKQNEPTRFLDPDHPNQTKTLPRKEGAALGLQELLTPEEAKGLLLQGAVTAGVQGTPVQQRLAAGALADAGGVPRPVDLKPKQLDWLKQTLSARLRKMTPIYFHTGEATEELMGPIRQLTAHFYSSDPNTRGNLDASLDKAITSYVGKSGEGLDARWSLSGKPGGLVLKEGYQPLLPEGFEGAAPPPTPAQKPESLGPTISATPGPSGTSPATVPEPVTTSSTGSPPLATRPGGPSVASVVAGPRVPPPPETDSVYQAITGTEGRGFGPPTRSGERAFEGLMPGTFKQYAHPGETFGDPASAAAVRRRIIEDYSRKYGGDPARIAVAFFTGPDNVAPVGSPTPYIRNLNDRYHDTAWYVRNVGDRMARFGPGGTVTNLASAMTAPVAGASMPAAAPVPPQVAAPAAPPPPFAAILPLLAQAQAAQAPPSMPQAAPAQMPTPQITQPGIPNAPPSAAQQPSPPPPESPQIAQQAVAKAQANPAMAQAEARAKIARNPAARPAVIAMLRAAGIQVPPDILMGR